MATNLLLSPDTIYKHIATPSGSQTDARDPTDLGWLRVVATWTGRRRQRRALSHLDERLLDDIGITRSEAAREIAKPFWR